MWFLGSSGNFEQLSFFTPNIFYFQKKIHTFTIFFMHFWMFHAILNAQIFFTQNFSSMTWGWSKVRHNAFFCCADVRGVLLLSLVLSGVFFAEFRCNEVHDKDSWQSSCSVADDSDSDSESKKWWIRLAEIAGDPDDVTTRNQPALTLTYSQKPTWLVLRDEELMLVLLSTFRRAWSLCNFYTCFISNVHRYPE